MKYLSIVSLILLSVLYFGCSNEDFGVAGADDQGKHSFRLMTRTQDSETAFNHNLVGSLDACLFSDSVLSQVYKDLTVAEDGSFSISSLAEGERIYFLANTHDLIGEDALKPGMKESNLLAMTMTSSSPQADGTQPVMTGKADFPIKQETPVSISLKRAIARIDLKITDGADIQINSISMDNVRCKAFLFAQEPVASPSEAKSEKIDTTFDAPLAPGEHTGIVYLYEQVGDGIPVTVHGTVEGEPATLSLTLPAVISRNCIYKMNMFSGANGTLQATISLVNEDWETGETVTSKPSAGLLVNSELSTLEGGAYLSATQDTLYLPSNESTSLLVLDNIPEDAKFAIDGVGTATITPLVDTRADIQGNKFSVVTTAKRPNSKMEYMYLNMYSGQADHYSARLVIAIQPNLTVFKGELLNKLTNDPPYAVQFDKYIDNVLGQIKIPQESEIAISGGNWLKAVPEGNGVYEIQAGYKPNDPEADGRIQECTLTVTNPRGLKEIYTFRRKNYGLPVVLMGDTYWCRYNLRGDSKTYEDQIQIAEAAKIADDAEYLANCDNDEFIRLLGSQYQGRMTEGFGIIYDTDLNIFVLDGAWMIDAAGIVEISNGPATSHCPDGYEIPSNADFRNLTTTDGISASLNSSKDYTTGSGKKATYSNRKRLNVICDKQPFGGVGCHKITIGGNSLVMAGMGHQTTNITIDAMWVYWASITGTGNTSWASIDRVIQPNSTVSKRISRTVRCIKSKPAFIIED